MVGKTLLHYRVTEKIGAGGMGVVYRATDTKLGREVAIKVLPDEFAKATERLARFGREARLLASLNHSGIAAIHGLEESDGVHFLVLELVEGETLAERLKRGALEPEDALEIALQIAEALDAAHEKGIIHRDLKPANVKVTADGEVKVLDFGLAKALEPDPSSDPGRSDSPTMSAAATREGVILGTAPYMSPEQARGKSVDKRSDVFSFGAVVFEMLTGQPPFSGDDVSVILASVIKSEPEWSRLPESLDPGIRRLLRGCLQKDRKERRRDMADIRAEVRDLLAHPEAMAIGASKPQSAWHPYVLLAAGASALVGAIIAGAAVWNLGPEPPPRQVSRL